MRGLALRPLKCESKQKELDQLVPLELQIIERRMHMHGTIC